MTNDSAADPDIAAVVRDLHTDLAAWLGSAADIEVFERFAAAQHPEFTMVGVDGVVAVRDALLSGLRRARNAVPGLRIDTDEVVVLTRAGNAVVVRFRETHRVSAAATARWVTAVLVDDSGGYRWHSVHETAIP
ncbi:hypothetical protein ACWDOP_05815 [Nocardia sp. NPDC003693]